MNEQKMGTLRMLWGAIFGGTLLFLVGSQFIAAGPSVRPPAFVAIAIAGAAMGAAVGSVLLPRILTQRALRELGLKTTNQASPGPSNTRRRPKRFLDSPAARSSGMRALQPTFVLGLALAEAVALHGFVLAFLGFPAGYDLPFYLVSWALLIAKFPRARAFEAQLENTYDADLV